MLTNNNFDAILKRLILGTKKSHAREDLLTPHFHSKNCLSVNLRSLKLIYNHFFPEESRGYTIDIKKLSINEIIIIKETALCTNKVLVNIFKFHSDSEARFWFL